MSATTTQYHPRTDKRPSPRSVYLLAHLLVDAAGLDWPATQAECSALIDNLKSATAQTTGATNPEVPF